MDLVLTDPPYNISTEFELQFSERGSISHCFGEWDDGTVRPSDWVSEAARVLSETGVLLSFYDNRSMSELIEAVEDAGLEVRQKGYWHKSNPVPQFFGVKWQEAVEEFLIATVNTGKGHNFREDKGQRHNVVQTPTQGRAGNTGHPTQKPEELISVLIQWWSDQGDLVVDPFAGSGTICVVAQQLGRQYIGIEARQEYVEICRKRLHQQSLNQNW